MATRMLIDARHSEETRVAVLKGNRIEEFDFESAEHKQIKGNIYLAKVTRVEPSLQAAFVDFGGNRHGFLAFSEIHPDYYQIPKEDREALLAEEAEAAEEEAALRAAEEDEGNLPGDEYDAEDESSEALVEDLAEDGLEEIDTSEKDKVSTIEEGHLDGDDDDDDDDSDDDDGSDSDENGNSRGGRGRARRTKGRGRGGNKSRAKAVDEARAKRMALRRRYKIQDVIQRRQVLLVQVVKEERGNKGAALTTYLSLAGRYTVLMPNSSHGGGISRKISSAQDRKRLKQVVSDLSLPRNMGLIVRTAGLSRTKTEIKRDFDYLARLWDEIRDRTLGSSAPALIHSDSDLIKRAIRDIYNREIEEVVVEGEGGYKAAKEFMKLLMPSHARRVKAYSDPVPLFQRFGAEDQLRAMYDPVVQLKSGGYLVINPTEALVSIDINSGRSTKEHGIEATATATNLEAAREIARQLRLRDMAGLVVIDFIDMEYNSNVRKVEKAMKDALKNDRARIQVGRISGFGLMEMSRQRLRTGVLEATTRDCPHCDGTGLVRTASSAGLSALRLIEDEAAKGRGTIITLSASTEAAVYMLNTKRADLTEIEDRYGVTVQVVPEGEDEGAKMAVSSSGPRPTEAPKFAPIVIDEDDDSDIIEEDDAEEEDNNDGDDRNDRGNRGDLGRNQGRDAGRDQTDSDDEDGENKRRRRRRGGRGRKRPSDDQDAAQTGSVDEDSQIENAASSPAQTTEHDDDGEERPKKRRRRGGRRRRGRGRGEGENGAENGGENSGENNGEEGSENTRTDRDFTPQDAANLGAIADQVKDDMAVVSGPDGAPETAEVAAAETAKPKRRSRSRKVVEEEAAPADEADAIAAEKPKRAARSRKKVAESANEAETAAGQDAPVAEKPKRASRKKPAAAAPADAASTADVAPEAAAPQAEPKPARKRAAPKTAPKTAAKAAEKADTAQQTVEESAPAEQADTPRRGGWWQRTFG
ncbi:Rne/Rng family ribonuclease [Altererythrobacter confluentis]|uniref:Ribonuclease E n=1 Tax=Allopontixanthobacter confluentis TaxID=1849021 RepID=A0A6L7GHS0_9SPHN|nr:ribonuclease E/G [Allopontixanthobacter confluentis]MXP14241.1 Rne/Rng family ribonuclease [Allopontixanthobacter confluentis]